MTFHTDIRLLEELKILLNRTADFTLLDKLSKSNIDTIDNLLNLISELNVSKHVKVIASTPIPSNEIFYKLNSAWISELNELTELMKGSNKVRRFLGYIKDKFTVNEIIKLLYEYPNVGEYYYFVDHDLITTLKSSDKVASILELGSNKLTKYVFDTLHKHEELRIGELNIKAVEYETLYRFWRSFIDFSKTLNPKIKLINCLRVMKDLELRIGGIRALLIKNVEAVVANKFEYPVVKAFSLSKCKDSWCIDSIINLFSTVYSMRVLSTTPISYDTLLLYVVRKIFESSVLSSVIYMLLNGLGAPIIKKYFGELNNVLKSAIA